MYGFNVSVPGRFGDVVDRVTAALETEGFGVLTDIEAASRPSLACGPHLVLR